MAQAETQQYASEIADFRKGKDSFFKTEHDSPIPEEQRFGFKGLKYFPPAPLFRVKALLKRFEKSEVVTMVTSKGTIRPYVKYGTFNFELQGRKLQLYAYKAADDRHDSSLFVPFVDDTSGRETYAAGRYLDLEETDGDEYSLDFNLAYNPYCAYNENYVCPIPPKENRLSVRVEAGELNYK